MQTWVQGACDLWQKQDVLGEPDYIGGRLVAGWVLPALVPISPPHPQQFDAFVCRLASGLVKGQPVIQ